MRVRRTSGQDERCSAGLGEVVAGELEEALHGGLLAAELLGQLARVLGGELEEVAQAALGVVGQRIDADDVLLGARRSPSAGGPRPASGRRRRR